MVIETEIFVDGKMRPLIVRRASDGLSERYDILVDGVLRHPNCTAEDVFRGLAHYAYALSYSLAKALDQL